MLDYSFEKTNLTSIKTKQNKTFSFLVPNETIQNGYAQSRLWNRFTISNYQKRLYSLIHNVHVTIT